MSGTFYYFEKEKEKEKAKSKNKRRAKRYPPPQEPETETKHKAGWVLRKSFIEHSLGEETRGIFCVSPESPFVESKLSFSTYIIIHLFGIFFFIYICFSYKGKSKFSLFLSVFAFRFWYVPRLD